MTSKKRLYNFILLTFLLAGLSAMALPGKKLPPANRVVVEYVTNVMGTTIGTGECADLLMNAKYEVQQSKVKSRAAKTTLTPLPGDYISFYNVLINTPLGEEIRMKEHHAIVLSVESRTHMTIAHQNHNGERRVTTLDLDLSSLTEGRYVITHP